AGSVTQIKACTFRLIELAKKTGVTIIIVGHVTKGGDIAGPKLLEHMVDVVLYFEGDRCGELRFLRSIKNRFGSTDEVGVFKMSEDGLSELRGESLKLLEGSVGTIGSALTILIEGSRPILIEIQALVTESFSQIPKRVFLGLDYNRGQLLMAVVQKSLGIPFYKCDVFVSVTGGMKIQETGADLAVIVAMYSSYKNRKLSFKSNDKLVFVGEVSLLGEVKKVRGMLRRRKEVEVLGMELVEVKWVKDLNKFMVDV
ncbi:DNA repair protein RadA, partial [Patescibacteria group bacterium]|nr:DNA repair protein RadA [Patescibacteria group bacterium]